MNKYITFTGLGIFVLGFFIFVGSLTLSDYQLSEKIIKDQGVGEKYEALLELSKTMQGVTYLSNISFIRDLRTAIENANKSIIDKYGISLDFAAKVSEQVVQLKENGYAINKHYQNSLPEIQADANMLYQSFLNVFINAMQAMPGGGTINVEISADENIVTINFDDEGRGIDDAVIEKIWDPFFTTKEMGTGLGLGIVKNIIESHGGSIQILNLEPVGARVTVELPVERSGPEE